MGVRGYPPTTNTDFLLQASLSPIEFRSVRGCLTLPEWMADRQTLDLSHGEERDDRSATGETEGQGFGGAAPEQGYEGTAVPTGKGPGENHQ